MCGVHRSAEGLLIKRKINTENREKADFYGEMENCVMGDMIDMNLYESIKGILDIARQKAYAAVNFAMVEAYWNIGKLIVETVGEDARVEYGKNLMRHLSENLTKDFGKGFDERNLRFMRQFYLTFPIRNALRSELSWSHYRMIMKVENVNAREYYLDECAKSFWSTRQLERQINSLCYERVLLSKNHDDVRDEIIRKEPGITPQDIIKDPYILEFLGLKQNNDLHESELENALVSHIQEFLLELGRGFSFVSRQKRITSEGGEHYYIDLVFYNYILKCFVVIDLKIGKLTYQDVGQIDFYVRLFNDKIKQTDDNPTIGIILCTDKDESIVKYSVLADNEKLFASKYKLYLPTEEELKREIESERDLIMQEKALSDGNDEDE